MVCVLAIFINITMKSSAYVPVYSYKLKQIESGVGWIYINIHFIVYNVQTMYKYSQTLIFL